MIGKTAWIASVATAGLVGLAAECRAESQIGAVVQKEYTGASGTRVGGEPESLYYRNDVFESETVQTGSGGGTALQFSDQTHLKVGASSKVVLDKFVYDPSQRTGTASINFGTGIFRFVTGNMNKDGFQLKTPTATLVVRGTVFLVSVAPSGATDAYIEHGAIEFKGCGGDVVPVSAGRSVHQPENCSKPTVTIGRSVARDPSIDGNTGDNNPGNSQTGENGSTESGGSGGGSGGGDGGGDGGGGGSSGGGGNGDNDGPD